MLSSRWSDRVILFLLWIVCCWCLPLLITQVVVQMGSTVGRGFVSPGQDSHRDSRYVMGPGSREVTSIISWLPSALMGSSSCCPILNLCGLNTFLCVAKFCRGTVTSILQGLHKGWWMVSLDLKDAYLHVLIHPSPVTSGIFGLLSGTRQESSLFINGKLSLLA